MPTYDRHTPLKTSYFLWVLWGMMLCSGCGTDGSAVAKLSSSDTTIKAGESVLMDAAGSIYDSLQWTRDGGIIDACKGKELCLVTFPAAGVFLIHLTARLEASGAGSLGFSGLGSTKANKDITSLEITVLDPDAPAGNTIQINDGAATTTSLEVTISFTVKDNAGIRSYYIANRSTTPDAGNPAWVPLPSDQTAYSDTIAHTLSAETKPGTYTKNVYMWFKDTSGNISYPAIDGIKLILNDVNAPINGRVIINEDAQETSSLAVTLLLKASDDVGVTGYYISGSSSIPVASDSAWTTFQPTTVLETTTAYTLSNQTPGTYLKTVYVWFKDAVGNVSKAVNDTITLHLSDTTGPQGGTITLANGQSSTSSTPVNLFLSASDDVGVTGYYVSESSITPGLSDSGWVPVSSTASYSVSIVQGFTLSSGDGTKTVYAWFKDAAGNLSERGSDSILLTSITSNASADATLSALGLSSGTLNPAFDPNTTSYSATLGIGATTLSITPSTTQTTATVSVNATLVPSGNTSQNLTMNLGSNTVTVTVTAEDRTTQKIYTITATRTLAANAYMKAANAEASDEFGYDVAISGDTLVIGAPYEDSGQTTITHGTSASADNAASDAGAVYVFRLSGTIWTQEAYLKAPNAQSGDNFGFAVAISGNTIVVGAPYEDSNQTTVTNGTTASADNTNTDSGAAYIFKRTGTSWSQEAYLKAPNNNNTDSFGWAVTIATDTVAIGVPYEDSNQSTITNGTSASADNTAAEAGAVYVFKRTGSNWAQEAYIKAPNVETLDNFGIVLDLSGDTLVVGAPQEDSNQTTVTNGTSASGNNTNAAQGAAYVFKRTGVNWAQEAYLKAPNGEANDEFGYSVAISGDTIVVGARFEDSNQTTLTNGSTASADNSLSDSGAAYVFQRSSTTWNPQAYLKTPNAESSDQFGEAVAIDGPVIVVGATAEDGGTAISVGSTISSDNAQSGAGSAYVFTRFGLLWYHDAYLKAPNAGASDAYGYAVDVDGSTIAVSSRFEDSNQVTITNGTTASADNSATSAGAVYIVK